MPIPEILRRTVTQSPYAVILEDEIAVWPKDIIPHKICIMGGKEDLAFLLEQLPADCSRKLKMVEGIEFIYE